MEDDPRPYDFERIWTDLDNLMDYGDQLPRAGAWPTKYPELPPPAGLSMQPAPAAEGGESEAIVTAPDLEGEVAAVVKSVHDLREGNLQNIGLGALDLEYFARLPENDQRELYRW